MSLSIPPLEHFIKSATALIGKSNYSQALHIVDQGFTFYPRSPYLTELLVQLPPDHVDYSPSRDQRARLAAVRYYEVLTRFLKTNPQSVIEFGSGQGSWISQASHFFSVPKSYCLAIDGPWASSWHDNSIPILACDLNEATMTNIVDTLPVCSSYDLAICVEVCEHLSQQAAKNLVSAITRNSKMAIFGSALTGQFGQGHRNCRSHYYWRALFQSSGFQLFDVFRPALQGSSQVPAWYIQNTYLYVDTSALSQLFHESLREYYHPHYCLDRPHPEVINMGMRYSLAKERSDIYQSLLWSVM